VVEIGVQEGDEVSEGDLLLRLDTGELERAVAQAELVLGQAELNLERLQEPVDEADIRQAEHAVDQAAAALQVAQLNLTAARNSALSNEALEDAQEAFADAQHWYEHWQTQYDQGEADYWFVDQAQQRYEDARLALERVQQQADLQVESAQNEVTRAWQTYQEAQDSLEQLLAGSDAREVEATRMEVDAARLALEDAEGNLALATLRAPFDGVVTQLNIDLGEMASPGEVILVLATLDQLQARTLDLIELDVARVAEGQAATVTVDAMLDTPLRGHVATIGLQAENYRGDVTYPVIVVLDDTTPELRWGMTAVVEIEAD
jgi:HlyD family secretion protein